MIEKHPPVPESSEYRPEKIYNPPMLSDVWRGLVESWKVSKGIKLPGNLPFLKEHHPKSLIGKGHKYFGEFEVFEHIPNWVLKVGFSLPKNTFSRLKEDKRDYDWLKKRFGNYIPETQFFRSYDAEGKATNMAMQKRIYGRVLWDVRPEEFKEKPEILSKVAAFLEEILKSWEEEGRTVDVVGSPLKELRENPLTSVNLMLQDGTDDIFLVDTGAPKITRSRNTLPMYRKVSEEDMVFFKKFIDAVKSNDATVLQKFLDSRPQRPAPETPQKEKQEPA